MSLSRNLAFLAMGGLACNFVLAISSKDLTVSFYTLGVTAVIVLISIALKEN